MKLNKILQSSALLGLLSIIIYPRFAQNIDKGKALNDDTMALKTKENAAVPPWCGYTYAGDLSGTTKLKI